MTAYLAKTPKKRMVSISLIPFFRDNRTKKPLVYQDAIFALLKAPMLNTTTYFISNYTNTNKNNLNYNNNFLMSCCYISYQKIINHHES